MYMLSWLSTGIQLVAITLAIGAGLYYVAELMEEYASLAKKAINYTISIDTVLALGLLLFEDLPFTLVALSLLCNLFYFISIRTFPLVQLSSPSFVISIILFFLHNYVAFDHFSSHYYEFNKVLCYLTLFCWLIPIVLLLSCSANDNVLPTTYQQPTHRRTESDEGLVNNYFSRGKQRKLNLLSFFRYFHQTYLPTVNTNKSY